MSEKDNKSHQSTEEISTETKPISSSIIKGVCDCSLLDEKCGNIDCSQLHLTEPIQLTDGHFHDRLLKDNWSCDDPYNDLLRLRDLIQRRPMVAIGLNNEQLSLQTEIFSSQIKLVNEFHLPLIIHCHQFDQQLFDILKQSTLDSTMNIQWHCCHSKGENVYREFLKYFPSSLLSIGGIHNVLKNNQWTNNLKINTNILQKCFNLT